MNGVHGTVSAGFEPVKEAFARNLEAGLELGGGFCAHVDGHKVVDIWGGVKDRSTGEPFGEDTLVLIFSATKGVAAICVHMLAGEGQVDYEAPVRTWWPEFAAEGKERIPLSWLLSHMAGLPTVDRRLSSRDVFAWQPIADALAAQGPFWEPGTAYGYHALTWGWLVGEVFRRASGKTIGSFLADRVSQPLGLDLWIGLPAGEEKRVSPVETVPDAFEAEGVDPGGLLARTSSVNHALGPLREWINLPSTWATELPAGNAITNARSLSRLYAATIGTVDGLASPLLSADQVRRASRRQTRGKDLVFGSAGIDVEIGVGLGFWVRSPSFQFGGSQSFGHPGASGAVGFADPENGVACGYVTNRMSALGPADPRPAALVAALYESLP